MRDAFAVGGETAKDAFYAVMKALESVEDPLMKNQIAVSLFGSKFEDLQDGVLPVLSGMKDATLEVSDSLSKINQVKYDNLEKRYKEQKIYSKCIFTNCKRNVCRYYRCILYSFKCFK